MRNPNRSIMANPVLVGAVTTLVVIVAVFLAYNANSGLPFVPTRTLNVDVPSGAKLVAGNEVRTGGYRVGFVEGIEPVRLRDGKIGARLALKLDHTLGALPVDTTVMVRPRSALGLKYVELIKGTSATTLPDGATLTVGASAIPVELDEFVNMFDARTRTAARVNMLESGDTFAGRGTDINELLQFAPGLLRDLRRVTANLNRPGTHLEAFFKELGDFARIVAPLSRENARVFTTMADTFGAIGRDRAALQATIVKTPPTLDVSTRSLRVQRPFLSDLADFSRDLHGGAIDLRAALPVLNRALGAGIPVTRRSVTYYPRLRAALAALDELVRAPTTAGALRGLTATITTLQPQLRYLGPYVTTCNYWNFFWTTVAEHFTAPDSTGGSQRALINDGGAGSAGPDNLTELGANEFAHGVKDNVRSEGVPQYLKATVFGNEAVRPDGRASCVVANGGYIYGGNRFQPKEYNGRYTRAAVDSPTAEDYPTYFGPPRNLAFGPPYKRMVNGTGEGLGPARVPAGQTFTNEPGGIGVNP